PPAFPLPDALPISLGPLGADGLRRPSGPGLGRGPLDDPDGARDGPGRVRDCHSGPGGAVVEGEHLHERAVRISRSAVSRASPSLSGSFPPASARVARPPPPPPMIGAISRMRAAASTPRPGSDL